MLTISTQYHVEAKCGYKQRSTVELVARALLGYASNHQVDGWQWAVNGCQKSYCRTCYPIPRPTTFIPVNHAEKGLHQNQPQQRYNTHFSSRQTRITALADLLLVFWVLVLELSIDHIVTICTLLPTAWLRPPCSTFSAWCPLSSWPARAPWPWCTLRAT